MKHSQPNSCLARCPLCHKPAPKRGEFRDRDYHHCAHCHLVFVPAEQHLPPELERQRYLRHDNTLENEGYVNMFLELFPHFERHWEGVESILDYGCGPGPVLVELLQRAGYEATGYDPFFAPEADLERKYDAVVSTETFEHFADVAAELKTIGSLLPVGGYLSVMTQFLPSEDPADWLDWYYLADRTHVTFFCPETFQVIAGEYGYELVFQDDEQLTIMRKEATAE